MKKLAIAAIVAASVALTGCADRKVINGKSYEPYGLVNQDARKDPSINYEVDFGSVLFAVVFSETILAPIYIVGWDLWEARSAKPVPTAPPVVTVDPTPDA